MFKHTTFNLIHDYRLVMAREELADKIILHTCSLATANRAYTPTRPPAYNDHTFQKEEYILWHGRRNIVYA